MLSNCRNVGGSNSLQQRRIFDRSPSCNCSHECLQSAAVLTAPRHIPVPQSPAQRRASLCADRESALARSRELACDKSSSPRPCDTERDSRSAIVTVRQSEFTAAIRSQLAKGFCSRREEGSIRAQAARSSEKYECHQAFVMLALSIPPSLYRNMIRDLLDGLPSC